MAKGEYVEKSSFEVGCGRTRRRGYQRRVSRGSRWSGVEQPLFPLADRYLAWLIAVLASANAVARAVQGLMDGRLDHLLLWGVTAIAMIALAILIDTVKKGSIG